jgi:hypothetical protein
MAGRREHTGDAGVDVLIEEEPRAFANRRTPSTSTAVNAGYASRISAVVAPSSRKD